MRPRSHRHSLAALGFVFGDAGASPPAATRHADGPSSRAGLGHPTPRQLGLRSAVSYRWIAPRRRAPRPAPAVADLSRAVLGASAAPANGRESRRRLDYLAEVEANSLERNGRTLTSEELVATLAHFPG